MVESRLIAIEGIVGSRERECVRVKCGEREGKVNLGRERVKILRERKQATQVGSTKDLCVCFLGNIFIYIDRNRKGAAHGMGRIGQTRSQAYVKG